MSDPSLRALSVLFVDCQSTGATPAHGSVLELGWARDQGEPASHLVELPAGATISRRVTKITGIDRRKMMRARPLDGVWRELTGEVPAPTVVHFATFEEKFLRDLHERLGPPGPFPFDLICTHAIATRLLPDLPRRGLRAIAGYFGSNVGRLRRSADHVAATQLVWRALVDELEEIDVRTLPQLRAWIEETPRGRPLARGWPMPKAERADLPDEPGVYRMLRIDGSLLYLGKARSLKKRVGSYFGKRRKIPERTIEMLSQARRLDWTQTETPLEAALLEQEEIKTRAPRYNVALRGDERSVWFASRDLASLRRSPDRRHTVGPVTDPSVFEGLPELLGALQGRSCAVPILLSVTWGPKDERLVAGIGRFAMRHPEVPRTLRAMLALGHALWPRTRGRADDEDVRGEDYWSPETVADLIEDRWIRAAHAIRQARWLGVLSEASVAWREGERQRCLVLERGTIESRDWLDAACVPPCPPAFARPMYERLASFDVTVRDRLRVLTTELRRLHDDGADPRIRTSAGALVRGEGVGRLLHWV